MGALTRLWRYAWAAPCTALGLLLAALPLALRSADVRVVDGTLEIALRDASRLTRRCLPFNAITFGHCVLGLSPADLERLRTHEHAHVRQYERWGALFLLAYPLASVWQWLRGRRAYFDNPFEAQARQAADETVHRSPMPVATWVFAGACPDGETFLLDGVDVWKTPWRQRPGEVAEVRDPHHDQAHRFDVYSLRTPKGDIVFAAGEFSNCIWGFYRPG